MMKKELKDAIQKSGNNIHMRTVEHLEEEGWEVNLSSYYFDDTNNRPREIDIIAKKNHDLDGEGKMLSVFLFIECKHFTNEIAFRMHPNTQNREAIKIQGINLGELLDDRSDLGKIHHYIQEKNVGKLYDTRGNTDNAAFNAITQPIKSLLFFRDNNKNKRMAYYPVVLYEGINGIYCVEKYNIEGKDLDALHPRKNAIYGVNYSYKDPSSNKLGTEYFCLDFINEKKLNSFLDIIEKESKEVVEAMQAQIRLARQ